MKWHSSTIVYSATALGEFNGTFFFNMKLEKKSSVYNHVVTLASGFSRYRGLLIVLCIYV